MVQPQLRPPYPPRQVVAPIGGTVSGNTSVNPTIVQSGAVGSLGPVSIGTMSASPIGLQQSGQQQWVQRPQIVRPPTQPSAPQECVYYYYHYCSFLSSVY